MGVTNARVIKTCYQCGKCTASCPLRKVSLFSPRIIAQDFILNEEVSDKIWRCLTCDLCSSRCPMGIKFSDFVLEQRINSFQKGGINVKGKMKAQVFYEKEKMKLEEVDIPEITDIDVLVKVKNVGICESYISYR